MSSIIKHLKTAPLVAELKERGFFVTKPADSDWQTLASLARELGVKPNSLHRTLQRFPKAPGIQFDAGKKRRRGVFATDEFRAWFNARRRAK
jgi:lambda repressor-like predicted transcriptional regulator